MDFLFSNLPEFGEDAKKRGYSKPILQGLKNKALLSKASYTPEEQNFLSYCLDLASKSPSPKESAALYTLIGISNVPASVNGLISCAQTFIANFSADQSLLFAAKCLAQSTNLLRGSNAPTPLSKEESETLRQKIIILSKQGFSFAACPDMKKLFLQNIIDTAGARKTFATERLKAVAQLDALKKPKNNGSHSNNAVVLQRAAHDRIIPVR